MESRQSIIRLFNVSKFYGKQRALEGITLDVSAGELVFITGASGAGKTTLLKLLYLGDTVSEGQILIGGQNLARITRNSLPYLRRKFGVIFQDFKLIPNRTVYENVALVLEACGETPDAVRKKVMRALKITGMAGKTTMLPPSLSGGEQQRAAVARAVVGDPEIIVADEPTGSLDSVSARVIFDLLMAYHAKGTTLMIATHNMQMIERAGRGRQICLANGRLEACEASNNEASGMATL